MTLNKQNFIVATLGLLLLLTIIDFHGTYYDFMYLLLIPIYLIPSIFIQEKNGLNFDEEKSVPASVSQIHMAWGLDFVFSILFWNAWI